MDYEVRRVEIDGEFKVCPVCGYKDGFHSMFRREGESTKWMFICPSCHSVFDPGFTLEGTPGAQKVSALGKKSN